MPSADRFFAATILVGRLHIRGISECGTWNLAHLEWRTEQEITPGLMPEAGDRIIRTREELEEAVAALPGPTRTLWIAESLQDKARGLWESGRINAAANRAMDEFAGRHTVTVSRRYKGEEEEGTGVLITHGGAFFVATAAHLVRPWPGCTIGLIPKPRGNLSESGPTSWSQEFLPEIADVLVAENEMEDVALVRLAGKPGELNDASFYETDLAAPHAVAPGVQVLLYGFPKDLMIKHIVSGGRVAWEVRPASDAPHISAAPPLPVLQVLKKKGYNSDWHFLMDFPIIPGSDVNRPEGMSGSGIWARRRIGVRDDEGWAPDLFLLGIQVRWHEPTRHLVATRIERVWRLLAKGQ